MIVLVPGANIAAAALSGQDSELGNFMNDRYNTAIGSWGGLIGWDQQAHIAGDSGWHRWEEDGVATLSESVANIGTFFIPVAGVAAGGTKTVLAGTRAGSIVAKTAGHLAEFVVPAGSYLVKGTVRVVDLGSDLAKGGWRGMIDSLTPGPIRPNALPGVAGVATDAPMALPPRTPVSNSLGLDGAPPAHTGGQGPVRGEGGTPHGDFDGPTGPERPAGESQLGEANGTEHQGSDSNAGNNNGSSAGRDALTDSTGRDLSDVLAQSDLSKPELKTFLQRNYPADYDQYQLTGQWPADVQIPRGASALTSDGRIDWDQVPEGGYVLENGKAVKETYVPPVGEVIDRYGPPNGRYTSPVPESGPYAYGQRSLPYVEDPGQYHQYKVVGDFENLKHYYEISTDSAAKAVIDGLINRGYFSWDAMPQSGKIAEGFGQKGGGTQYEMPLSVDLLVVLKVLEEI